MSDRRVLQIIETELAKAVTFIDLEDERIMSEELSDRELIDAVVSRNCWKMCIRDRYCDVQDIEGAVAAGKAPVVAL